MAGVSGSLWEEEQFVALVVKKKERDLPHSKIIRKHNIIQNFQEITVLLIPMFHLRIHSIIVHT